MKVNVKPWIDVHASISFILLLLLLVIDITRAEDIMADNSLSPRAEDTIIAIISKVKGYNYFIFYLPIP